MPLMDMGVSVVIPVKNRLGTLRRAVASIAEQVVPASQLIIVDDGSRDHVREEDLLGCGRLPPLLVIRNERSIGAAQARNVGVAHANCPVIAFLDSDDAFSNEYIQKLQKAWAEHPEAACIAAGFYWCTNSLRPYRRHVLATAPTHAQLLVRGNIVGGASVLSVKRDRFIEVSGFPPTKGSHDWGLLLRLSRKGLVVVIPEPLVYYQSPIFSTSPLTSQYRQQILSVRQLFKEFDGGQESRALRRRLIVQHLLRGKRHYLARRLGFRLNRSNLSDPKALILMLLSMITPLSGGAAHVQKCFARLRSLFYDQIKG